MKTAVLQYSIITGIAAYAFLNSGVVSAQTTSFEGLKIIEYINQNLKDVVLSLERDSIKIEWAAQSGQHQTIAFKTVADVLGNPDQEIYAKCFFKRTRCYATVIKLMSYASSNPKPLSLHLDPHQYPYNLSVESAEGHTTIFISKGNLARLKERNDAPVVILPLQEVIEKSNNVNRYCWASLQVGFPYYESLISNFGTSIAYSSDRVDLVYILQYKATKYSEDLIINNIDEISYMSAYLLSKGKIRMTFCAGLSYIFWRESYIDNNGYENSTNHNRLGVPVEAQYYVRINEMLGLGVSLRGNLNGFQSFYQFGVHLLFGKIR